MRPRIPILLIPLALTLGSAGPLGSQVPAGMGSTVRVASAEFRGIGTLLDADDDRFRILVEGLNSPVLINRATLTSFERRRSATTGERLLRGAAWGAGIGAAFGLVGFALGDAESEDLSLPGAMALLGFSGAFWGGVIGIAIPQSRWERTGILLIPTVGARSTASSR